MLIYNKKLSVSPITTHLPIKYVSKNINKSKIIKKIKSINNFLLKIFKKKTKDLQFLGLNPHCETIEKIGEEKKKLSQQLKNLKRKNFYKRTFFCRHFFYKKKYR